MNPEKEFLRQAQEKFGDRFNYSDVQYKNVRTQVKIVCKTHGIFTQTPFNHIRSVHGCPKCFEETRGLSKRGSTQPRKYLAVEKYLERVNLPPGYLVDVSQYIGVTGGKVGISCPTHGTTWESPRSVLIRSYPCAKCGQDQAHPGAKNFADFRTKADDLYQSRYSYDETEYENRKSLLTITCSRHGPYQKTAQKHLSGQHCPFCTLVSNILDGKYPGGYSDKFFQGHPEAIGLPATLYYARVGRRYKIGVTGGPVDRRLASIRSKSKQKTVLIASWSLPLKEAYRQEQNILALHSSHRIARRWSTEVFDIDVLHLDKADLSG